MRAVIVAALAALAVPAAAQDERPSVPIAAADSEIYAKRIRGAGYRCPAAVRLYHAKDDGEGFDLRLCCGPKAAGAINAAQCYRLFLPRQGNGSITPWRR